MLSDNAKNCKIQQVKPCGKKYAADNITEPMHARNQSTDNHKHGEKRDTDNNGSAQCFIFYARTELYRRRRHNAQRKQGCGRRIRRFQITVYKNGTIIHDNFFKQQINRYHYYIEHAKGKNAMVHLQ